MAIASNHLPSNNGVKNRILLVEDDDMYPILIEGVLNKYRDKGFIVIIVPTHDEAIKEIQKGGIAALITDNNFPNDFLRNLDKKLLEPLLNKVSPEEADLLRNIESNLANNPGINVVKFARLKDKDVPVFWNSALLSEDTAEKIDKVRIAARIPKPTPDIPEKITSLELDDKTVVVNKADMYQVVIPALDKFLETHLGKGPQQETSVVGR